MRNGQQRTSDSLDRVRSFAVVHTDVLGAIASSAGKLQVDAAVTAIAMHVNDQGTAVRVLAGQMANQKAQAKELITSHMGPIAKFARAKLRGVPDLKALTAPVSIQSPKVLVEKARSMATAAANHADVLTVGGFPSNAVAQLSAAADALDATIKERTTMRSQRVTATKGIAENLKIGREGVKMLGALIDKQFASDKTFMAGWTSASRVNAKPGSVRVVAPAAPAAVVAPKAVTATVAPAAVAAVAPAVTAPAHV